MRKRSRLSAPPQPSNDKSLIENLIGLGDFSARKSYYPELLIKIEELEQEKERYKWLFENALHGIFQAEADGAVKSANPAIAAICGYSSSDALAASIDDIGYQLFHCHYDYQCLMEELCRSGKRLGFETRLKTFSGGAVDVSMNVLVKSTQPLVIEAFVQDITERKKAQRNLTRLNESLEQRVQQRTKEVCTINQHLLQEIRERREIETALSRAKQEAEQANRSKDKYLAAASHDLLQPLNAARLLISTLRERPLAETDQKLVDRVHVALLGAEELLTDLLDISKLDANAMSADYCDFPIDTLLQALETEFTPVAANAGLHLRIRSCNAIIRSDARLLMRILRNLLSNAIRYTQQGRVLLACRLNGNSLKISVYDTGPGIPKARQREIFREFKQLDNAHCGHSKGVGLGLAIVERIANMLEHPLGLSSEPDKGSCFSVDVPLGEPLNLASRTEPAVAALTDLTGLNILVIDNEEAITHGMQALLQQWGAAVLIAHNAEEAQAHCQRLTPDLILVDYHLDKGSTGFEAMDRLQALLPHPVDAILITADRSDDILQECRRRRIRRLNKPVKPGKLRSLITHLISRQRVKPSAATKDSTAL